MQHGWSVAVVVAVGFATLMLGDVEARQLTPLETIALPGRAAFW